MKKFETNILRDLYESVNGLYAFTFYSRYKIEPEEMFLFIEKYTSKGIVIYEDDKLLLTKEGKNIVLKQLFHKENNVNKFSRIPREFISSKIKINEPYLPNIISVSKEILKY